MLLIADEVICGFGRTGNLWGSETYGLKPDMLTCAKALSAAYMPISAVMISEPIYEAMVSESEKVGMFGHGFTYAGHPVATAVALETLKIYEERDILSHVRAVSPHFQASVAKLVEHPLIGDVRGVGLVAGMELVRDKESREAFDANLKIGDRVQRKALEHGLITRSLGDRFCLCPPLIIEDHHVDQIIEGVSKALDDVWADLQAPKAVAE